MGREQRNSFNFTFLHQVYTSMLQHCMGQKPLEACGLLSGSNNVASTHWPMVNVLHSPNEFQMDMKQIEITFKQIEEKREQLVGIYHSHPTAAPYPSPHDVIHANYPDALYVIVSLAQLKPEVACFHIHQGVITHVQYGFQ